MINMDDPDKVREVGDTFKRVSEDSAKLAEDLKSLQTAKAMGASFGDLAGSMQKGLDKVHVPFKHHSEHSDAMGNALHQVVDKYQSTDASQADSIRKAV